MSTNRSGAPTILGAPTNPILLAWALMLRRRLQLALAQRGVATCSLVVFFVLGASIAVATWQLLRLHGAMLLAPLQAHAFTMMVAAAAISWATTARSRRRIERQLAQSWLASAPVSAHDRRTALRWRVGGEVILPFVSVMALILGAGLASATVITQLLATVIGGFVTGTALGWRTGGKPLRSIAIALPRLRLSQAPMAHDASLAALGRWPFAQLRAAANPHLEVRLFGALLLSMPMGIPAWIVLLILAFAATVLAALSLLRASLVMIPAAADWLRATPLGPGELVRASCLRAAVWQVGFAAIAGTLVHVLGAPTGLACALSAGWLGVCVTALASAHACRHHPGRLVIELFGIGALLLAIASVAPYALVLVWPALWAWQATRIRNA